MRPYFLTCVSGRHISRSMLPHGTYGYLCHIVMFWILTKIDHSISRALFNIICLDVTIKFKTKNYFNCENLPPRQGFELAIPGLEGRCRSHWATEASIQTQLKQSKYSRGFMKEQIWTMTWHELAVRCAHADHIFKIGPVLRPRVILAYHTHSPKSRRSLTLYNAFLHLRCKKA